MTILRNILAFIIGAIVGGLVNMAIISIGPSIIPNPAGMDASSVESIAKSMALLEPRHFITPFLAHAIGTFFGALVAFLIAKSHKAIIAYLVGALTLVGGIAAAFMIPAPAWFIAADLILAYIPMAWLAILVGRRVSA